MTHIPDEAVQAALDKWNSAPITVDETSKRKVMHASISAALPYLSAPCDVEAVKLKWFDGAAQTAFGEYTMQFDDDEEMHETPYCLGSPNDNLGHFHIEEEDKAAAQTDFERRILSCVVTKPVDVEAVRRQAFEVADKTLDDLVDYWKSLPSFNRAYAMRSTIKTAADLRALSAEPA